MCGPLNSLSATMVTLADGDLSATVTETERRDEIGGMARAVQVFKDNSLRTRALETSSQVERAATEAERERNMDVDRLRAAAMTRRPVGLPRA